MFKEYFNKVRRLVGKFERHRNKNTMVKIDTAEPEISWLLFLCMGRNPKIMDRTHLQYNLYIFIYSTTNWKDWWHSQGHYLFHTDIMDRRNVLMPTGVGSTFQTKIFSAIQISWIAPSLSLFYWQRDLREHCSDEHLRIEAKSIKVGPVPQKR